MKTQNFNTTQFLHFFAKNTKIRIDDLVELKSTSNEKKYGMITNIESVKREECFRIINLPDEEGGLAKCWGNLNPLPNLV